MHPAMNWFQSRFEILITLACMMPLECCWIFLFGVIAGRLSKGTK